MKNGLVTPNYHRQIHVYSGRQALNFIIECLEKKSHAFSQKQIGNLMKTTLFSLDNRVQTGTDRPTTFWRPLLQRSPGLYTILLMNDVITLCLFFLRKKIIFIAIFIEQSSSPLPSPSLLQIIAFFVSHRIREVRFNIT